MTRELRVIADRFVVAEDRSAVDLATGRQALVRVLQVPLDGADYEWSASRDALAGVSHAWLAECLDFGGLGEGAWFEAYSLVRATGADGVPSDAMTGGVQAFLNACGIAVRVRCQSLRDGRTVVPLAPLDPNGDSASAAPPRWPPGRRLVARPSLDAIAERLQDEPRPGVAWCDVAVPPGAGGRTWLRQVARDARRLGWVPVSAALLTRRSHDVAARAWAHMKDRHVVVLDDDRHRQPGADDVVQAVAARIVLSTIRPGLVVRLVDGGRDAMLRLPPLTLDEHRSAHVGSGAPWQTRGGAQQRSPTPRARRHVVSFDTPRDVGPHLVRETQPAFEAAPAARRETLHGWIPGVERPLVAARSRLERGRHADASRLLRQAARARTRRGDRMGTGRLLLAAGEIALDRGRVTEAQRLLGEAGEALATCAEARPIIECALALGRTALLALDAVRAEASLRGAAAIARRGPDDGLVRRASAMLADTLWWLGRFDEAAALLPSFADKTPMDDSDVAIAVLERDVAARVALAQRAPALAARHVHAIEMMACGRGTVAELAAASARARWAATTGDLRTLMAMTRDSIPKALRVHRPLQAIELRVLRIEGALHARALPEARDLARGLAHVAAGPVPPLVSARARVVLAALERRADSERLLGSLVARGFGAFACPDAAALALASFEPPRGSPMLDDVLEMLRVCQDEEPRAALARVAELLRARCSAALVAILTGGTAPVTISMPPAARSAIVATRRALEGGLVIDLHAANAGHEAAAPMRYAGALVGAVGCRWLGDPPADPTHVRRLLEAAAAAAGPCAGALGVELQAPALPQELPEILGTSHAIEQVRRAIARAADAPFNVIVEGESGVGKELAARAIHRAGPRRSRAFCVMNGAALPDDLLEAELFGHARGAFTGAVTERRGLFEEADGGTLFLDEVGELSPRAQAKLLRAIQEGEVRRLGEAHVRKVDVRLVTATNRSLEAEIAAGRFRRDLFYRLAVIRIEMPPLRERAEDVPALAAALWARAAARVGSRAVLSASALAMLARYDWPGNVRELQNVLAALAVSAPRRGVIGAPSLPAVIAREAAAHVPVTLDEARRHFEARFVRAALARAGWQRGRAAADLGLTRQGLAKLMERLGIDVSDTAGADG